MIKRSIIAILIVVFFAGNGFAMENWSCLDMVWYGDLVRNSINDVVYTTKQIKCLGWKEDNPLLQPIAGNGELHIVLSFCAITVLTSRWSGIENSKQRSFEMLLANLIEATALHASRADWHMTVYAAAF